MAGAFRGQAQNGGAFAQAPSPSDRLLDRGYLDKVPPSIGKQGSLGPEQDREFNAYIRPRIDTLKAIGVPGSEAYDLIRAMPDVETLFERLGQEGQQDPQVQEEIRRLLDRMR
jgi:hypothetical protein